MTILARVASWGFLVWLAGLLTLSCAGQRLEPRSRVGERDGPGVLTAGQHLFQVRYSGPDGGGSLRLVLRMRETDSYQILASDTFGQARWSLEYRQGTALLLDHKEETFCQGQGDLALGEASLQVLPLDVLPRVLLGVVPIASGEDGVGSGSRELIDEEGRKWSIRSQGDRVLAWTLWQGGEPLLWWTYQAKGGILSHREGSQFRWRRVVEEPLPAATGDLVVPESYSRVRCHVHHLPQLRQDQPAPPGQVPSK